jgi:Tol biopolymer transport system component
VYVLGWGGHKVGVETIDPRTWQAVGKVRRLTDGTTDENSPSVSADRSRLVFASLIANRALYELPVDSNRGKVTGPLRRLNSNEADSYAQSISIDGKKVAFVSDRTGSWEIFAEDLPSGQERALTTGGKGKWFALITRDGDLVAWKVDYIDRAIFATPFSGGTAVKLCADCGVPDAWSADRKYLVFNQRRSGRRYVGLWDVATGAPREYMEDPQLGLRVSSISDDGKWIAFSAFHNEQDFTIYVAPFSPDRSPPRSEWIPIPHSPWAHPNPCWSPDGSLLYFSSDQDGYSCIWAERLNPSTKLPQGEPFAVQHFHSSSLRLVAPSFTNPVALAFDKIVLSLASRSGGIWMMKLKEE